MNNFIVLDEMFHTVNITIHNLINHKIITCGLGIPKLLSTTYFNIYAQRNLNKGCDILTLEEEFKNYMDSYWYPRIIVEHPKIFKNNFNLLNDNTPVEGWLRAPYHWCKWNQLPDMDNFSRYEVCGKIMYIAKTGYESMCEKIQTNDPAIIKTLVDYNIQLVQQNR